MKRCKAVRGSTGRSAEKCNKFKKRSLRYNCNKFNSRHYCIILTATAAARGGGASCQPRHTCGFRRPISILAQEVLRKTECFECRYTLIIIIIHQVVHRKHIIKVGLLDKCNNQFHLEVHSCIKYRGNF